MKTCSKCGEEKEEFVSAGYTCKDCSKIYGKKYREENRDKIKVSNREYFLKVKDTAKEKERRKNYLLNNKEKINKLKKEWVKNNPDKDKKYRKKHRGKYREKLIEGQRKKVEICCDSYINELLNKNAKPGERIKNPPELIEAKRLQVLINRHLKG